MKRKGLHARDRSLASGGNNGRCREAEGEMVSHGVGKEGATGGSHVKVRFVWIVFDTYYTWKADDSRGAPAPSNLRVY